jgi:unsaturated rhamnogalacturonyl hydrolase
LSLPNQAYLKEILHDSGVGAKVVVIDRGDVMMAVAKYGKGTVFADPWVYNEYVDRRNKLPVELDGFAAAIDLAGWGGAAGEVKNLNKAIVKAGSLRE